MNASHLLFIYKVMIFWSTLSIIITDPICLHLLISVSVHLQLKMLPVHGLTISLPSLEWFTGVLDEH